MLFTLEALKAKEGDCLILHWGTKAQPLFALIDGGPSNVYDDFLRPRLDAIVAKRGGALDFEIAMVSHIDADHITGVKNLFRQLRSEVEDQEASPITVKRLWHNTFDDIIGNSFNAHYQKFTASFEAAADGHPPAGTVEAIGTALEAKGIEAAHAAPLAEDIALVLAGHREGRGLRDDHRALFDAGKTQALNAPFKKTLITAELTPAPETIKGLEIRIVGPMQPEIDALQADFDKYLAENHLATATTALAAYSDKSIPNLSSIVCLVACGTGAKRKTILLTGDARGDKILAGLEKAGLIAPGKSLHVDVLKGPHHGSDRNVEAAFFDRIVADTYIFSGDGKHGNPERATLGWLTERRGKAANYTIVLTYKIDVIDKKRKEEKGAKWDDAKDSLRVLFDACKAAGHQFKLIEDAPVKIELGDEKIAW